MKITAEISFDEKVALIVALDDRIDTLDKRYTNRPDDYADEAIHTCLVLKDKILDRHTSSVG